MLALDKAEPDSYGAPQAEAAMAFAALVARALWNGGEGRVSDVGARVI
jgi:hypothetical protein